VVGVISYAALPVIAWMLSRTVSWTAAPGLPRDADPRQDPLTIALRTALVLSVAWLITSMYTLSWYDLIAWMPLAVLAASKLDRIMLMRIAPLSLAYVPGRALDVGPALDFTASRIRDTVSPIVQFGVLLAVILWWRKPEREELFPFRRATPAAKGPLPVLAAVGTRHAKSGDGKDRGDYGGPIGQPMPTGRSRTRPREVSARVSRLPSGGQQNRRRPRSR
jgi:alpha-1,6-mannosyltransferase